MKICLQCAEPIVKTEKLGNIEVNICSIGHRTGFLPELSELEKRNTISELYQNGLEEKAS